MSITSVSCSLESHRTPTTSNNLWLLIKLEEQLACDEEILKKNNSVLLENVNAVRKLACKQAAMVRCIASNSKLATDGKLEPYQGCSIVLHQGTVVAAHDSSLVALNMGIRKTGTKNVYMIYIPSHLDD